MTLMFRRIILPVGATLAAMLFASAANAAGALAIGDCGANGYSYSYGSLGEAAQEALQQCRNYGGRNCKVVEEIQGSCAAFAIDGNNSCGAQGWGRAPSQAEAESIAIQYCQQYGGSNCKIRPWVCR